MRLQWIVIALLACCAAALAADSPAAGVAEFNRAVIDAGLHMDHAASLALWEDDGVSLLPSMAPMIGKRDIAAFLDKVTAQLTGAHTETFTLDCHDIEVSGDWASEWCENHQVVKFSGDRPPFDGHGKLLYVLHRGGDGRWRIKTEMWNQGAQPTK